MAVMCLLIILACIMGQQPVKGLNLGYISEAPSINIKEEVYTINASDTLEIICWGQQILEWTWPRNQSSLEHRISVNDCTGYGLFCKNLTLSKAIGNDTGSYKCAYKDLPQEEGKTSSSIYIYIEDHRAPFVSSSSNIEIVFIQENTPVVIPCLGSFQDLNVTLFAKYPDKEIVPDGKIIYWNSRKGFIVPSSLINFAGIVRCQTIIDGKIFQSPLFMLTVVGYKIKELWMTPPQQTQLIVGEKLVINCTVKTELNVRIDFKWTFLAPKEKYPIQLSHPTIQFNKKKLWDSLELLSTLIIENVTMNDTGMYICTAFSGRMEKTSNTTLIVYAKPFISIEHDSSTLIEAKSGDRLVRIPVKFFAYPPPLVEWKKNGNPIHQDDQSYKIKNSSYDLNISYVTEKDAGNYTVILKSPLTKEEYSYTFQLVVNVSPHIREKDVANEKDLYELGSSPVLKCTADGIPSPVLIQWQWISEEKCIFNYPQGVDQSPECNNWKDIARNSTKNPIDDIVNRIDIIDGVTKTVSILKIRTANASVKYRCLAKNKVGQDEREIIFHVTRGLKMNLLPSDEPIEKDNVTVQCKADRFTYKNLKWYQMKNNPFSNRHRELLVLPCKHLNLPEENIEGVSNFEQDEENIILELNFQMISSKAEGAYVCQAENVKTGEKHCVVKRLSVKALQAPHVTINPTSQHVNISETIELTCTVSGTPTPVVTWIKDNATLMEDSGIVFTQKSRALTIQRVKKEDMGVYHCMACNDLGCQMARAVVSIEGAEEKKNVELIILIGTGVIALFFWLLLIIIMRTIKRSHREEFKTGYLSIIVDPDEVPMEEFLTYDPTKWEFPRDRLKLGKPLGRGAFGQVVEAAAFGIQKASTCTTVAVKMLKEGATSSEYRALMSELKILIHIGHHLNIVNLLGACTKPGSPLMVIVEYCRHGNLSNYLKSKRGDYTPYKNKRSSVRNIEECDKDLDTTRNLENITSSQSSGSSGFDENRLSCNMEDEEELENHQKTVLTMEDLISYSFQVAKGMEFLASRKCIHRDLAARNILLSENNVVKICDFGLARDVYRDPDYVRKGDARLPLKWMAPETIFDRVYTTQSDVWSFGVLLWEIFSLGASPYPGVAIDEEFCRRLRQGTRMRAPDYASPEIYQTMLDCWLGNPKERPTFVELVEHLGNLLELSAQKDGKDYIPLTVSGNLKEDSGLSLPTSPVSCVTEEQCNDSKNNYANAAVVSRYGQGGKRKSRPVSVKTFEDIPVEQTMAIDNQTDSGMILSSEELKVLENQHNQILKFSKSKESVASENSNHTTGYHSDDTDTVIYSNEEAELLYSQETPPICCMQAVEYDPVVRYSAPPV
uniref:receptor protein-tyrosine kinase n=1 Tax=Erpetoichthys calabaricus TaxID=27687 RepID=A0A8C4SI23_ERPCA